MSNRNEIIGSSDYAEEQTRHKLLYMAWQTIMKGIQAGGCEVQFNLCYTSERARRDVIEELKKKGYVVKPEYQRDLLGRNVVPETIWISWYGGESGSVEAELLESITADSNPKETF